MDGDMNEQNLASPNTASLLCGLLHATNAKVIGRWDRVLRQYGIDFSGYVVLLAIYERWPIGENELSLRLNFDPYTFEEALADLERCRLISRGDGAGGPADRPVNLSPKAIDIESDLHELAEQLACDFKFAEKDALLLITQLRRLSLAVTDSGLSRVACERLFA